MSSPDPLLNLGAWRRLNGAGGDTNLYLPASHFVTHGVVVGMTGSGKTGLLTVIVEEAARSGIPCLVIDVKGDLPNLLLTFPTFDPSYYRPWIDPTPVSSGGRSEESQLRELAVGRQAVLAEWRVGEPMITEYSDKVSMRVLTPGATMGEAVHVLSSLERRSSRWETDPEAARDALSAAVSLVLRLIGRDADPARSKEHVLLSVLAERRLSQGKNAELGDLMADLEDPPIEEIGALPIDSFLKKSERRKLAASLNSLLASPTFACWRKGLSLDVGEWLAPKDGRTPVVVLSVAHLDDEERTLVLGLVFEELLCWVRSLGGTQNLRSLVVFDEVYGFMPPHPANPPTKRPMVALMKQARAFGVGIVIATQNPMDVDYRALSNAGLWFLGRLQTDADRERVLDGLGEAAGYANGPREDYDELVQNLGPRWFVVRNARAEAGPVLMTPRWTIAYMKGPMTRVEIKAAREQRNAIEGKSATKTEGADVAQRPAVSPAPPVALQSLDVGGS